MVPFRNRLKGCGQKWRCQQQMKEDSKQACLQQEESNQKSNVNLYLGLMMHTLEVRT